MFYLLFCIFVGVGHCFLCFTIPLGLSARVLVGPSSGSLGLHLSAMGRCRSKAVPANLVFRFVFSPNNIFKRIFCDAALEDYYYGGAAAPSALLSYRSAEYLCTPQPCFGRFIESGCFHLKNCFFSRTCCDLCVSTDPRPSCALGEVASICDLAESVESWIS